MGREFRVGDVFGQSLSILFANLVPFSIMTGLVTLPVMAYAVYAVQNMETMAPAEAESYDRQSDLILTLLDLLLSPIATGAVTFGVLQQLRGKRASMGECLAVGLSRMFAVMGTAICVGLLTGLGFVALIVPGLIVMCVFFVAVPCAVVEGKGIGNALSRSRELTRGSRWKIFAILFLMFGVQFLTGWVIGFGMAQVRSPVGFTVVMGLVGIVFSAWQASAQATSYYYLRSMKESVDIDDIASVFD